MQMSKKKPVNKIKEARLRQGYSQLQMAALLGVSYMTYNLWERGVTKRPNPENLRKLEQLLGVTIAENEIL